MPCTKHIVSRGEKSMAGASSQPLFDSWIHFLGGARPQWSLLALGAIRGQHWVPGRDACIEPWASSYVGSKTKAGTSILSSRSPPRNCIVPQCQIDKLKMSSVIACRCCLRSFYWQIQWHANVACMRTTQQLVLIGSRVCYRLKQMWMRAFKKKKNLARSGKFTPCFLENAHEVKDQTQEVHSRFQLIMFSFQPCNVNEN